MSEQYSTLPNNNDERASFQDFIIRTYNDAVHKVQDGVSYLKNGISEMYQHSGYYFEQMASPVNNFLKDLTQIESEFSQENNKQSSHFLRLDGKLVPAEQAIKRSMEENY